MTVAAVGPQGPQKHDLLAGLEKGLAVIEAFDQERPRLTISEVAERTGLTRAAARRYQLTLTHLGLVHQERKMFALAPRVLRLAQSDMHSARLPRVLQPALLELAHTLKEASAASVLDAADAVCIAATSAGRNVRHSRDASIAVDRGLPRDYPVAAGDRLQASSVHTQLDRDGTTNMRPALRLALTSVCTAAALVAYTGAQAQAPAPLKVGLMLPSTGTFAALGDMIERGFRLYVQEQGGKLGGREIQYFRVDDESDPSKATDNVNKLIKRDNVDVIVGTVHSGVALAMARAAKESNTMLIVPNAGADAITGAMCAPHIFRSSFSNWQPGYATGVVAAGKGYKRAMTITWNYAAGAETVKGFTEAFEKGGGKVMKDLNLPFPGVEFQALLTEIAAQKPDVVFAFFAGGGAVKFV